MKEFIKPIIEIIQIENDQILCSSGTPEEGFGPSNVPVIDDPNLW